jgi:hypothetical protein
LQGTAALAKTKRRLLPKPSPMILILIIVVASLGGGLIGAEQYARKRANNVVATAAECEVKDKVKVSIGIGPSPFLLQHFNGHYTDISIHTAGNQIRGGKGMKADITVKDVDLHGNANSKGIIGAVDATISWMSAGIKETVQDGVPFGNLLIRSVKTNPAAGTIQLSGAMGLGSITVKPRIAGGGLSLEVVKLTAIRAMMPRKTAQKVLEAVTSKLTKHYPLGVRADSVQVTDHGLVAHFSARNAVIPNQEDPCFAHI